MLKVYVKSAQRCESREQSSTTRHSERVFLLQRLRFLNALLNAVQHISGIDARA
jgi:hypothetical protein